MRCPFCGNDDTQVKDSRPTEDNTSIRRRRFCPACGARFTTFERVQLRELTVLKKTGKRVPFDRDKLARSIQIALRKRPIDPERIERLTTGIVRRLESMGESEIPSDVIGEMVMDALSSSRSGSGSGCLVLTHSVSSSLSTHPCSGSATSITAVVSECRNATLQSHGTKFHCFRAYPETFHQG